MDIQDLHCTQDNGDDIHSKLFLIAPPFFLSTFSVQLNEPFDESTPDGREVTTVVTFENSRFITVQTAKNKEEKSTKFCIN